MRSAATFAAVTINAHAQEAEAIAAAQRAAQSWLAEVDSARYLESWDRASSAFQAGVSKAQWVSGISPIRTGIGAVKSRRVKSTSYTRSLPGAPEGEYVIIEYDTQFVKKTQAIETVTPMRDKDGQWRVSGYFIN